jgi:hypothetical protein
MEEIYATKTLAQLQSLIEAKNSPRFRKELAKAFLKHCEYKNVDEWNRAVRLCEALTIAGWGDLEPVEASLGKYFNGYPNTAFFNKDSQRRFVSATWSKRTTGLTMESNRTVYHFSPDRPNRPTQREGYPVKECIQNRKLQSQRNWIPKCPISVSKFLLNCYPKSEKFVADVKHSLTPSLNKRMRPEVYGGTIDRIQIWYHLSYPIMSSAHDFVVFDEAKPLSRRGKLYSKEEIKERNLDPRNRFEFGGFRSKTGSMRVDIYFARDFDELSYQAQKREFAKHLGRAVDGAVERLKPKKLDYDLDQMSADFHQILADWTQSKGLTRAQKAEVSKDVMERAFKKLKRQHEKFSAAAKK